VRALLVEDFGGPESLVLADVEAPAPGPGEVVVQAHAIGVNFPDLLVIGGTYQVLPERPFSPGKEVAGVVAATGPGVSAPRVGNRVIAQVEHGAYRELVLARADACVALPGDVAFEDGAALGLVSLTAWLALVRRARLRRGETVLVTAAGGGVGSAAVQLARALGATVIASAASAEKRALAGEQGADHVIGASPDTLRDEVAALTGGRGADVVVESVGGDLYRACLRATAWEGRVVVVGFAGGEIPEVKAGYLLVKNIAVLGLQSSDYRDRDPELMAQALREVLEFTRSGRMGSLVGSRYPLERAPEALDALAEGRFRGKIVLTVGPS
jgi:NADPH:quinone reductase-like Zn-dependent oxidoreductase